MAYLEDDFIDDGISDVEISDDELNAVFSVTEDGEDWDDEAGDDDDDDFATALDMLDDENFGERLTAVYEELKAMGFAD